MSEPIVVDLASTSILQIPTRIEKRPPESPKKSSIVQIDLVCQMTSKEPCITKPPNPSGYLASLKGSASYINVKKVFSSGEKFSPRYSSCDSSSFFIIEYGYRTFELTSIDLTWAYV